MKQLFTIAKREIAIRIRSKAFFLFSIISPILFTLPFIFSMLMKPTGDSDKFIAVIHEHHQESMADTASYRGLKFYSLDASVEEAKELLKQNDIPLLGILYIADGNLSIDSAQPVKFYVPKAQGSYEKELKNIEAYVNQYLLDFHAEKLNLAASASSDLPIYKSLYPIVTNFEKDNINMLSSTIAYTLGMLLYLLLILFNNSILRSVAEEKSNRLAEVLSMHVKPFNLMFGKILGSGFISLLQLILWVAMFVFYLNLIHLIDKHYVGGAEVATGGPFDIAYIMNNINYLPLQKMLIFIPMFFIFGFLLNGAFTTAIGVTVTTNNNGSLSFLGNIINIASIYIAMFSASFPQSAVAKVAIYFPFFSPMAVPAVLPYGLPTSNLIISLVILVISFALILGFTSRVYKLSIIANGNKVSALSILKFMVLRKA